MRIPRIHVDIDLESGVEITLPADAARRLCRVLRLPDGARLLLFNGEGGEFEGALVSASEARVRVGARRPVATESRLEIGLAQGLSRGDRMDFTIQKAVELGVRWIQPLLTERSVVRLDRDRAARRRSHWRGIVASACEQCGRTSLPPVHDPLLLCEWLERLPTPSAKLLAAAQAPRSLAALPRPGAPLVLLVGPEGGLASREVATALEHGFESFSLGPRTLRTETAAVMAVGAAQLLWGDLGDDSQGER